jgi:hypothetical protein
VAGGDDLHLPLPWLRWRRQKLDDPLATVDVRQMEVCLSILPLIVGLSLVSSNQDQAVGAVVHTSG